MIIPDVNMLVYAHNRSSRFHQPASYWWESALNGETGILLPNICINGFVRIMTHPKIMDEPLAVGEAFEMTDIWLQSPCLTLLAPSMRHYALYKGALLEAGVGGKLTTDAYLAALAMENQGTLFSNDSDFSRFSGLRWENPLG
jgi:toxin-antitoxin system PIN domain toxin